jgi:hypothetical protein
VPLNPGVLLTVCFLRVCVYVCVCVCVSGETNERDSPGVLGRS